ncbi:MAG: hypothetical protein H0T92_04585 [Pyrinomonadaceae bacterium]|nr:hypothetical protein [Pyrinomonadaceae bacterium]
MSKQKYVEPYMWLVTAVGAMVCAFSAYYFPYRNVDSGYLLLALITVGVSSRLTLKIPRLSSHITVSDTFIFLVMLLYGGEAAILLAAVEGFFSSLRVNRKRVTYSFNAGVMACSTFFTVWVVRLCFGSLKALPSSDYSATLVVALCVMALAQYFFNSGLVAVLAACKIDRPGERSKTGAQAANSCEPSVPLVILIPGYHPENVSRYSSFSTLVRTCSRRCAPRFVHLICCFFTILFAIT